MDKNSVTGMVLIALILGVFWWMNKPSEEEIAEQKRRQDSIALVDAAKAEQQAIREEKQQAQAAAEAQEPDSVRIQKMTSKYGMFAGFVNGDNQFYTLENEFVKVKLSSKGAKVYSVELKEYTNYLEEPLVLFDGDKNIFGFNFTHNLRNLNTNDLFFEVDEAKSNKSSIRFKLALGDGEFLAFDYKLAPDSYMLDFDIVRNNVDELITSNTGGFDLQWKTNLYAQEKGRKFEAQYAGAFFKYDQDDVEKILGKSDAEDFRTPIKWLAFKDQVFFCCNYC